MMLVEKERDENDVGDGSGKWEVIDRSLPKSETKDIASMEQHWKSRSCL